MCSTGSWPEPLVHRHMYISAVLLAGESGDHKMIDSIGLVPSGLLTSTLTDHRQWSLIENENAKAEEGGHPTMAKITSGGHSMRGYMS